MNRFPDALDVLVIGGGPAGLATAVAVRRLGLRVAVLDGAAPPIDKPCGEGLMPDGVDALRRLGIAIPQDACPFRGIRFVNDGAKAEAAFPHGVAYGIRRTRLHSLLLDHAEACGVLLFWKTPVTGLHAEGALIAGKPVGARWVVGADGIASRVRTWAKLDSSESESSRRKGMRFAFRRHYRIAPWTDFMELHWAPHSQAYVTPVGRDEVCLALVSSSSKLRIEDGLAEFPELRARLEDSPYASTERGAITTTRQLPRVYRGRVALVGDASGGVDAVTGEGLCLAFRQAALLADCLASRDLARYQRSHAALLRRPAQMARLMLFMARHNRLGRRAIKAFQSRPRLFAGMLAMHVGEGSAREHISNGLAFGWELLKV